MSFLDRQCVALLSVALVGAGAVAGCAAPPQTALEQLIESRRLTAEMLLQLEAADSATNRAIMADTDEASAEFVAEARRGLESIAQNGGAVQRLLEAQAFDPEARQLAEFDARFKTYAALTGRILDLALLNTNSKAQRLSFGPALAAADAVRDALMPLRPATPSGRDRVTALSMTVMASVREIHALQAPHIADARDEAMTRLEQRMDGAHKAAKTALVDLAGVVHPDSRAHLDAASRALQTFMDLNAEIISLSRQNSDVHSLALALGEKRTRVAACVESLRALQAALAKRGFAGTR